MFDVSALLATLMAEREKLTAAIVALEGLRRPPAVPIVPTVVKARRGDRRTLPSKYSTALRLKIAAKMRATEVADGVLAAAARDLGRKFKIPSPTIVTQWRKWEQLPRTNGPTDAFTPDETAAATGADA